MMLLTLGWPVAELHHAWRSPERRTLHDVMAGTTVVFRGYRDDEPGSTADTD